MLESMARAGVGMLDWVVALPASASFPNCLVNDPRHDLCQICGVGLFLPLPCPCPALPCPALFAAPDEISACACRAHHKKSRRPDGDQILNYATELSPRRDLVRSRSAAQFLLQPSIPNRLCVDGNAVPRSGWGLGRAFDWAAGKYI
jgi:hypothetical protein